MRPGQHVATGSGAATMPIVTAGAWRRIGAWTGVLLVCALLTCLSGASHPITSTHSSAEADAAATAEHAADADTAEHDDSCPAAEGKHSAASVLLASASYDADLDLAGQGTRAAVTKPSTGAGTPLPVPESPPDLNRLCVSRT
jgi:hypothetical protein